ncbi:MAG TPA: AI-2E family transporter [Puia sp.]|nr:AI-2E family transporter [Puia sp.]
MTNRLPVKIAYTNLAIVLTTTILYFGKPVFMPLAIAGVLALVFMPFCRWMEKKGVTPVLAAIVCGVIFSLLITAVILFTVYYFRQMSTDLSNLMQTIHDYNHIVRQYLHDKIGVKGLEKESALPIPLPPDAGGFSKIATSVMGTALSVVINLVLILIYMIMLLCIRGQIKIFILKLVAPEYRGETRDVISRSAKVVQRYLWGLFFVIACLWVMYMIGFSLVGVHNALFFAILCGLLEVVPFVGNITGSTLTSIMALSQGGGMPMVLGVLGTYALIQFIQFYIITPLVMREQVSIHPLFTIVILIAGELVWGIPGMILAIPALGIFKIVCDHVETLYPFGYLIGHHRKRKHRGWRARTSTHID